MEIISVTRGDHPSDSWRLSPSIKGMLPFRPACLIALHLVCNDKVTTLRNPFCPQMSSNVLKCPQKSERLTFFQGFEKMMIMEYELNGIGKVKMTVGIRRRTKEKVQYCITAINSL